MIVVSDTTPIISFLKIDRLDILHSMFGEVLIPQKVFDELTETKEFPEEAKIIKSTDFIKMVTVPDSKIVFMIQEQTGLDLGESEAIAYTSISKANLLLIDETKGRLIASSLGLKIMGTIGILMQALKKGFCSKEQMKSYVQIFKNEHRHISDKLLKQLLEFSKEISVHS